MRYAGATLVWYGALIAGAIVTVVLTGWDPNVAVLMTMSGVVPWPLATVALWLIARRMDVQRRALIVMALPIYALMWFAFVFTVLMIMGPRLDM